MRVGTHAFRMTTIFLAVLALSFAPWILVRAQPSQARQSHSQATAAESANGILEAELDVSGMTCPFCAFGIEKKLRAVRGVSYVRVLLDDGRIVLRFSPGNRTQLRDIEDAVEKSGFTLSRIHMEVRGALERNASEATVRVGPKRRFLLLRPQGDELLSGPPLERLANRARKGPVTIFGLVERIGASRIGLHVLDENPSDDTVP